ncbi:hypothetical protein SDC9_152005 [bioreactor metagenome]|uniref:Uncharacterized protein n=1 Tax=bioreactor metagenome TaxID=1076179 RepID=A0A645ERW0_9ZZZZ
MISMLINKLIIKDKNAATEPTAKSLSGGNLLLMHSPSTTPNKPKTATKVNECRGLIKIAMIAPATKSVMILQRMPCRIPQRIIGNGQIKFKNMPTKGTYILMRAKTIAIAAIIPASTIAEVLCATKFPPQKAFYQ